MADLLDNTAIVTDRVFDPLLAPEEVPMEECVRRYRRDFPDVIGDPELAAAGFAAFDEALGLGMRPHEALPMAGRIARQLGRERPAPDDSEARSAAIREMAASRPGSGECAP